MLYIKVVKKREHDFILPNFLLFVLQYLITSISYGLFVTRAVDRAWYRASSELINKLGETVETDLFDTRTRVRITPIQNENFIFRLTSSIWHGHGHGGWKQLARTRTAAWYVCIYVMIYDMSSMFVLLQKVVLYFTLS